jgi:hypothetical protein
VASWRPGGGKKVMAVLLAKSADLSGRESNRGLQPLFHWFSSRHSACLHSVRTLTDVVNALAFLEWRVIYSYAAICFVEDAEFNFTAANIDNAIARQNQTILLCQCRSAVVVSLTASRIIRPQNFAGVLPPLPWTLSYEHGSSNYVNRESNWHPGWWIWAKISCPSLPCPKIVPQTLSFGRFLPVSNLLLSTFLDMIFLKCLG